MSNKRDAERQYERCDHCKHFWEVGTKPSFCGSNPALGLVYPWCMMHIQRIGAKKGAQK